MEEHVYICMCTYTYIHIYIRRSYIKIYTNRCLCGKIGLKIGDEVEKHNLKY